MILYVTNDGEALFTEASKKRKRKTTVLTLNDNNSPMDFLNDNDELPGEIDDDTTAFMDDLADDGYPSDIMDLINNEDLDNIPEGEDEYPGGEGNDEDEYPGEDPDAYPGDDVTDDYPGDTDNGDDYPGDNTPQTDEVDDYPGDAPEDTYPGDTDLGDYPGGDTLDTTTGSDAYPGADNGPEDAYPGDTTQTTTGDDYPAGNDVTPATGADDYPGDAAPAPPADDAYPGDAAATPIDDYPGDAAPTTGTTDAYPGDDQPAPAPIGGDAYPGDAAPAVGAPMTPGADAYPGDTTDYTAGADPNAAPNPTGDAGYPGGGDMAAGDPNAMPADPNAAPIDNTDYTAGATDDTGAPMDQGAAPQDPNAPQGPGIGYDSMRNFNLYKEYEKLLDALSTYIEKINGITIDDIETNKLMKYCSNKLTETRDLCYDYMVIKFEASTYVQNRVFYQTLVVTIQLIFDTVAKIVASMNNEEKKK